MVCGVGSWSCQGTPCEPQRWEPRGGKGYFSQPQICQMWNFSLAATVAPQPDLKGSEVPRLLGLCLLHGPAGGRGVGIEGGGAEEEEKKELHSTHVGHSWASRWMQRRGQLGCVALHA